MTIDFYPAHYVPTPDDVRDMVPTDTILYHVEDQDDVRVNMHNAGGVETLRMLGLYDPELRTDDGCEDQCGALDAETFLGGVLFAEALADVDLGSDATVEPLRQNTPADEALSGARWHTAARPAGTTQRRLAELRTLAEHCRANGWLVAWA